MSEKELGQNQGIEDGEKNLDNLEIEDESENIEEEETPILGRFKSEKDALEYINSLEEKKEANKKDEALSLLTAFRENSSEKLKKPEVASATEATKLEKTEEDLLDELISQRIERRIGPLEAQIQQRRDELDAQEIMKLPNYDKYVDSAHLQIKKNPGLRLLEAFKSVYDVYEITKVAGKTASDKGKKDSDAEKRRQQKRMAQVENSRGSYGQDLASPDETKELATALGVDVKLKK
jgi:hypothetical protein